MESVAPMIMTFGQDLGRNASEPMEHALGVGTSWETSLHGCGGGVAEPGWRHVFACKQRNRLKNYLTATGSYSQDASGHEIIHFHLNTAENIPINCNAGYVLVSKKSNKLFQKSPSQRKCLVQPEGWHYIVGSTVSTAQNALGLFHACRDPKSPGNLTLQMCSEQEASLKKKADFLEIFFQEMDCNGTHSQNLITLFYHMV